MRVWLGLLLAALWLQPGQAAPPDGPAISIIIDDLGVDRARGQRAIALPGPVACAFLPHSPHTRALARSAHAAGKEVVLHLPMQAVEPLPLGPGGVFLDMTRAQFAAVVARDLAAVPHARGINNHMGSLLTRHPGHMLWLMQEIRRHGALFFVDSRTTSATVAWQVAQENGVPSTQRDVFLDHDPAPQAVRAQFERLLSIAAEHGSALGIGHPYGSTLAMLEEALPGLAQRGVRLIRLNEMIELQRRSVTRWRASWSPSPPAVKSSRP